MTETEITVRRHIASAARPFEVDPDGVNLTVGLKQEFGISSMKLVLLMTRLCKEFGVTLSNFDERDLATIDTGADLIRAFDKVQNGSGS